MIPFSRPTLGNEETDAVKRVLESGWIAAGPETNKFEKEFAEYVGVRYAIFTNSGTSALKMAYKYFMEEMGLTTYSCPKNTFCATYSAAEEIGLKENLSNKESLDCVITNVHYGGVKDERECNIEDSAHRIEPNDPMVGKIRIYSFYATKNMTTGSGGMIVTNSQSIYKILRYYWSDGIISTTLDRNNSIRYDAPSYMAGGYDGNDISASIGREQLKKLPEFTKKRNQIVEQYNEAFEQYWTGNHLYPYMTNSIIKVYDLRRYLYEKGISSGYHYPGSNWTGVSLPIYPTLSDDDLEKIIYNVLKWKKKEM
jgi:perosamine synthetase